MQQSLVWNRQRQWLALALFVISLIMVRPVQAATLTTLRDYLSRQQGNLTSGENHQLFFTPATSLSGSNNKLTLTFPDDQDGTWCRTAAADFVALGIVNPAGVTENATPLPGTYSASCSQGSGSGSTDRLQLQLVGALTAGVKYGVSIADGTIGRLGTPPATSGIMLTLTSNNGTTDIDSGDLFVATTTSDQVTISATVIDSSGTPPKPVVEFRGLAASSARLSIVRNGVVAQTATTNADATFDVTLLDQPTGASVYELSGTDIDGNALASVTFAVTLTTASTTIISGVFLGPSIHIDHSAVNIGTPVTISGGTAPNSEVTLTIHSVQAASFTVTSDSRGRWQRTVQTTELGIGSHTAFARAMSNGSNISAVSSTVNFSVNPILQCDGKATADVNCDGKVNLTDFSILLFFWLALQPSNARVDINHDGSVNITDFSIMLFQWTA